MNTNTSRILWIIAGVLLIIAGILCLFNPGTALVTLSLYLGIAMLVSGIIDIVIFAKGSSHIAGAGWILADGILTVIMSLFLLFDQAFAILSLTFIFGMWLIFSGISQFVHSFELKRFGVRGWGWFTAIGILLTLAGFFSFMDPVAELFALGVMVGIMFLCQGIAIIVRACFSHRMWR